MSIKKNQTFKKMVKILLSASTYDKYIAAIGTIVLTHQYNPYEMRDVLTKEIRNKFPVFSEGFDTEKQYEFEISKRCEEIIEIAKKIECGEEIRGISRCKSVFV